MISLYMVKSWSLIAKLISSIIEARISDTYNPAQKICHNDAAACKQELEQPSIKNIDVN